MARDTRRSCDYLRERPRTNTDFSQKGGDLSGSVLFRDNAKASTVWRCVNGHAFHACYNNVDQEMNCTLLRERTGFESTGTLKPPIMRLPSVAGYSG